jgi:cbb3-type cytochrome oxidase maturation protein
MTILPWLIAVSLVMGCGGLALFLWSLRSGQFDDLDGAAQRILFREEDEPGGP